VKCGEIWLNLWEASHPITKAEITVCKSSESISDNERIAMLDEAESKLAKFVKEILPVIIDSKKNY
jgi:hypothetical protein